MIQVLVSDLGQVVLPFDFELSRRFVRERCPSYPGDAWERLVAIHEEMGVGVGRCSADDFYQRVAEELGLGATFEEFGEGISRTFWEDPATIGLLRRARVSHRFLLSNTNAIHWEWLLRHHGEALAFFDRLLASHEIGLAKPDPAVYRHVESLTGLPSSAHLLIDDLAENVEGARACGWDGIIHVGPEHLAEVLGARGLVDA